MKLRVWSAIVSASLLVPAVALAGPGANSVTVVPFGAAGGLPVPALGLTLMVLLAVMLFAAAIHVLRRGSQGATVMAALLAVSGAVTAAYAGGVVLVVISGQECNQETTENYSPFVNTDLVSQCANQIQIVDIDVTCSAGDEPATRGIPPIQCNVGRILSNGDRCRLPNCIE